MASFTGMTQVLIVFVSFYLNLLISADFCLHLSPFIFKSGLVSRPATQPHLHRLFILHLGSSDKNLTAR